MLKSEPTYYLKKSKVFPKEEDLGMLMSSVLQYLYVLAERGGTERQWGLEK
jgi:hypothetical protein